MLYTQTLFLDYDNNANPFFDKKTHFKMML